MSAAYRTPVDQKPEILTADSAHKNLKFWKGLVEKRIKEWKESGGSYLDLIWETINRSEANDDENYVLLRDRLYDLSVVVRRLEDKVDALLRQGF